MHVVTAAEAASQDADAIAAGTPGLTLMTRAATQAAAVILRLPSASLARGVSVLVGHGHNGGDGYLVAAQLARCGVAVRVYTCGTPRSPDARTAERYARAALPVQAMRPLAHDRAHAESAEPLAIPASATPGVVVDALLGTGASGPLRDAIAPGAAWCNAAHAHGAIVVALDMPTGVDATSGARAEGHVRAHITIAFGNAKTGLLAARDAVGRVVVVDIGVDAAAGAPRLADASGLRALTPPMVWHSHKGTRGRVALVGGSRGMAGAMQFSARGALHSGAGLVRAIVHPASVPVLQATVPAAMTATWPAAGPVTSRTARHDDAADWAHALGIGPGLGRGSRARDVLHTLLDRLAHSSTRPSVLLDADALVLLARHLTAHAIGVLFRHCAATRPVVLTPHAGEFARLASACNIAFDIAETSPNVRLRAATALAQALQCTVLLKGTPTVCADMSGAQWYVPRGTAVLATGGTGDLLTGVLSALLAADAANANGPPHDVHGRAGLAAVAAWVHGVAGELATGASLRGPTVDDIAAQLPEAWSLLQRPTTLAPGIRAELPSVR